MAQPRDVIETIGKGFPAARLVKAPEPGAQLADPYAVARYRRRHTTCGAGVTPDSTRLRLLSPFSFGGYTGRNTDRGSIALALPGTKGAASLVAEKSGDLPVGWQRNEGWSRDAGDDWLRGRSSCLLAVPSAILPEEMNYVYNPTHRAANSLRFVRERPFSFDPRLI